MRKVNLGALVLAAMAVIALGCAERAAIRTYPPDAKVTINGQFVGVTPVNFTVPRSEWVDHYFYEIERDGYHAVRGELPQGAVRSRTVGMIATAGVMLLFKRPTTFKQDLFTFALVPLDRPAPIAAESVPTPKRRRAERPSAPSASPAAKPADTGDCELEQVLAMKNAGMTDEQVNAACPRMRDE